MQIIINVLFGITVMVLFGVWTLNTESGQATLKAIVYIGYALLWARWWQRCLTVLALMYGTGSVILYFARHICWR